MVSSIKNYMDLEIRDAVPEDNEMLAQLDMEIFPNNCFNETTLREELRLGGGYLALIKGEPVGYSLFRVERGLVDILRLGVTETSRCRGLGGALLALSMKKGRRAMLTVKMTNMSAINLYRKHGFVIAGTMPQSGYWVMTTSS
jgi:ribosomal protein S18 acetylase RimI-like enzyme